MLEPVALQARGHEVLLVTFQGIIDKSIPKTAHIEVAYSARVKNILHKIRQVTLLRWPLMLLETFRTLSLALRIYEQQHFDVIYVRDGDPFLFVPFLLTIRHWRRVNMLVSVTGSVLFAPQHSTYTKLRSPLTSVYSLALSAVAHGAWRPLYSRCLSKHNIRLVTQNDKSAAAFRECIGEVFHDYVVRINRGVDEVCQPCELHLSRQQLRLDEAFTILSFGAPHQGKNLDVVFQAASKLLNVQVVHGGMHVYSLGGNPADMVIKYNLEKRAKVFDYFIPEDKKPLFFGAANVVVLSYTKVFASTSSMLLEAAKFGVPVIASNNHPLGDDVLRYGLGLCFEAENVDSLVSTIKAFRGLDAATREQMRKNGVQYAANNSINKWAAEWERQGKCLIEN